jgi:hypothetical protein
MGEGAAVGPHPLLITARNLLSAGGPCKSHWVFHGGVLFFGG